jgi:hypothetical protein
MAPATRLRMELNFLSRRGNFSVERFCHVERSETSLALI